MPLPPSAELINPVVRRGPFRVALFDFDGTLSLIREGWPRVMIDLMLDRLRDQCLITESEPECAAHIEAFVMALNGHPTVRQMERFVVEVTERGGTPAEPTAYLQQYIDRLMSVVHGRWEAIESRRAKPSEWVVPNAHGILRNLQERGVPLFVASGTDLAHVSREVELLELLPHVGGRVYAPKDNDATFRKRDVIERAVRELAVRGDELIGFGDGVVETQEVKRAGGVAVGVASSEAGVRGVNATKRETLIAAGADIIIPDYEHADALLAWLWG
ncbi:HAD family phosphatase [Gemmata sp. G18]|uniref:phosphoglycolate phosphatase n=1 Tax=Gemmata palustris TaxID=2822762 RepID=A0ABS5BZU2_9BACT|nr:HAD family phosphatase [Gemmata palustris]MBP3959244.1 HAD family phosphatase [Gemmata palustris]